MNKIPVGPTIRAAYRFVFTHLGAIIGLIWLPMIVVTVAGFFVEQRYYEDAADAFASGSYAAMGPSMLGLVCYFVVALLLYAAMYVPVTQLALGLRKGHVLAHMAIGPAEWRLFRAFAGVALFLLIPVLILVLLGGGLMDIAGDRLPAGMAGLIPGALFVAGWCALLYLGLRFVFLLPALAASENGPPLPRSWMLSAGNFWRILLVVVATLGPVAVIADLAEAVLQGPRAVMPEFSVSPALAAAQLHALAANMPTSAGISFLIAPLVLGLISGASAAALAALTGRGEVIPPP